MLHQKCCINMKCGMGFAACVTNISTLNHMCPPPVSDKNWSTKCFFLHKRHTMRVSNISVGTGDSLLIERMKPQNF